MHRIDSRFPAFVACAYQAKCHYHDGESLHIHYPQKDLSTAENILYLVRPDNKFTRLEAELLDLSLVLHAEHGGGNNSSFTTHVVTSSGTDTYSAIAAAVGSLKGPKHGGANAKVMAMMEDIKANVCDWSNDEEVANYIRKILRRKPLTAAVWSTAWAMRSIPFPIPRAVLLKEKAEQLAEVTGMVKKFELYKSMRGWLLKSSVR